MKLPGLIVLTLALTGAAPAVAQPAPHLADGNDWKRSSIAQQRAYLAGVSNMISVGAAWDAKNTPGNENTFSRTAQRGLKDTGVEEALKAVDSWYQANPSQLSKPVLSVVWRELAKPKLPPAK